MSETFNDERTTFRPSNAHSFAHGAFSADELQRIIAMGEAAPVVPQQESDAELCRVNASRIYLGEQSHWLFQRLFDVALQVNQAYYRYELTGFEADALQYTVYHGSDDIPAHYEWHIDIAHERVPMRKLVVVVSLSDPTEFEGGQLHYWVQDLMTPSQDRGTVNVHPAWMMHRVTPVTKGTRRTLVGWLVGPNFR